MRFVAPIGCGVGGAAALVIAWCRFEGAWILVPFAALAVVASVLAWIDLTTHRLPNRIVVPTIAAAVPMLGLAAVFDGAPHRVLGAVVGGAALFGGYLLLALLSPAGMGMGDVKLAAIVGCFAGSLGFTAWLLAAIAGFVLGGVVATAGILAGRARRDTAIPFGPWMLVGLWVAVAVG
jgi:leader peptidase (prepilin peptidase)/N-methyltransferase